MSDKHRLRLLYHDQKGICFYCQKQMTLTRGRSRATIDHRIPRTSGGTDQPENLVAACITCNSNKASLSEQEFLSKLARSRSCRNRRETRRERRVRLLSYAIRQRRIAAHL